MNTSLGAQECHACLAPDWKSCCCCSYAHHLLGPLLAGTAAQATATSCAAACPAFFCLWVFKSPASPTLFVSTWYLDCSVVMTFSMYSISLVPSSTQEPEEQCHQGRFHSWERAKMEQAQTEGQQ